MLNIAHQNYTTDPASFSILQRAYFEHAVVGLQFSQLGVPLNVCEMEQHCDCRLEQLVVVPCGNQKYNMNAANMVAYRESEREALE